MKSTRLLLLLPALLMGAQAVLAQAPKTITLTATPNGWNPRLGVENGPIFANEKVVAIKIDMPALVNLAERRAARVNRDDQGAFYRETRGFREAKATITVDHTDGTATTQTFEIAPDSPSEATLALSEHIKKIDGEVTGLSDVYKCFDADTCVFEKTVPALFWTDRDFSAYISRFRPLVSCSGGEVVVEANVDAPEQHRMWLTNDELIRDLEIHNTYVVGQGVPARNGAEFERFTASVGSYHTLRGGISDKPYRQLHVTRENGGLKLRIETEPHYFCNYTYNNRPETVLELPTPLGQACAPGDGVWSANGSSPGADEPSAKDWFVESCEDVP